MFIIKILSFVLCTVVACIIFSILFWLAVFMLRLINGIKKHIVWLFFDKVVHLTFGAFKFIFFFTTIKENGWATNGGPACLVAQSCRILCDPILYSPDSSVRRILQARTLEWVVISSSRGSSRPRDQAHVYCVPCIGGGFFIC